MAGIRLVLFVILTLCIVCCTLLGLDKLLTSPWSDISEWWEFVFSQSSSLARLQKPSLSLSLSFGSRPAFRLVGSLRFCLNIALFCILIWAVQTQTQIMHRQKAHCSPIKRKDAPNRLRQQITIILINSLKPSLLSSEYKLNEIVYSYPFRFEWIKLKQKYWVDMKSRKFLIRLNWANKS